MDSHPSLTFSADDTDFIVFSSILETNPTTGAVQVTLGDRVLKSLVSFIDSHSYHQVVDHSRLLSTRIFGAPLHDTLAVKWNLLNLPAPASEHGAHSSQRTKMPLSYYDQKYRTLLSSWTLKSEYCRTRGYLLEKLAVEDDAYREQNIDEYTASFYGEALFLVENFVLELHLWHQETAIGHSGVLRQILPESIRAMQSRIATEKGHAITRCRGYKWENTSGEGSLSYEWDQVLQALLQIRVSERLRPDAEALLKDICSPQSTHLHPLEFKMESYVCDLVADSKLYLRLRRITDFWAENRHPIPPTPRQKLKMMLHAMFFRLHRTLSGGFSTPRSNENLWWTLGELPDSASWGLYIHSFAPEVLRRNTHSVVVEFFMPSSVLQQEDDEGGMGDIEVHREGGEGEEEAARNGMAKDEEMEVGDDKLWIDYLSLIAASEHITTLSINNGYFDGIMDNATRVAARSLVTSNLNIICLSGVDCHYPGEDCAEPHCQAVFENRQAWKWRAQNNSLFASIVGFEACDTGAIQAMGDHIRLSATARCLVLYHCPGMGELTVILNVRRRSFPISLEATLQSDLDKTLSHTEMHEVPVRPNKWERERIFFRFSYVPKGTGEIVIKAWEDMAWKIHGEVKVEWSAGGNNNKKVENDEETGQLTARNETVVDDDSGEESLMMYDSEPSTGESWMEEDEG
ncbi:hypothetical protein Moror_2560 [Moniliophthora roreri MCA 2997]|nr:hypothetical protein Moror_2560 [Moniliophthora roreri MCA 2997]